MALLESDFEFIDLPVFDWELTGRDEADFEHVGVNPGAGGGGAAPSVALILPAGQSIEPNEPVVLEVTDADSGLRRTFLAVRIPSLGIEEVAFQGDRFAANYSAGSSRTAITDGFRYTLRRAGGWPASPTVDAYAIDTTGQEA